MAAGSRLSVCLTVLFACMILAIPPVAFGADESGKPSGGSFQPPILLVDNDLTYVSGAGIVGKAGPMTILGGIAGFGKGLGKNPQPTWGFESGLATINAWGDIEGADAASSFKLSMLTVAGSILWKFRPLRPENGSVVGITLYGGPNLGMLQLGITNNHGTAYRHFASVGLALGGLVQLIPHSMVELMAFGGGRGLAAGGFKETDDPKAQSGGMTMLTPEFGGNIVLHLPYSLDLSLSSLFNFFDRDEEERSTSKIFTLGLSWKKQPAPPPVAPGEPPPAVSPETTEISPIWEGVTP